MCQQVEIGGFIAEKQENGTFLYKSKNPSTPIPLVKVKDKPQFKVIYSMEDAFKESGKKMINQIGIDITKLLAKK